MPAEATGPAGRRYLLGGRVAGHLGATGLLLDGERIVRILGASEEPHPGATVDDFRPHLLAPGTIDVHTHGGIGLSFSSGPAEDALAVCRHLPSSGTTALLPTVTGTWDELSVTLPKLASIAGAETGGATVLGVHLEGPFINPAHKGAISPATMRPPDVDDLRRLQDAARGGIAMMTVAPELPGAQAVIEEMVRLGIVPSIGHSDAPFDVVLDAASAGARKSTHTFNAMRPLLHRDPGVVGGILGDARLVAELIPDGAHVHAGAMRVLLNAKGPRGTCLVTDAVRYAGLPDGIHERAGRGRLTVADGVAVMEDGTIAGSVSPADRNLRLLHEALGVPLDDLFVMAAGVPAGLLGAAGKGSLRAGADADVAVYDAGLRCLATYVAGRRVYAAP